MSRSIYIAVPLLLVAALAAALLWLKPLDGLSAGTPPAEDMAVERVTLDQNGIHAVLRATG
ncbi:MAG: metal transporter, partial [Aestuariivirgaceae bacterium]